MTSRTIGNVKASIRRALATRRFGGVNVAALRDTAAQYYHTISVAEAAARRRCEQLRRERSHDAKAACRRHADIARELEELGALLALL